MIAKRIERPQQRPQPQNVTVLPRTGRWRAAGRKPTRGPQGDVFWWERPAPRDDEALWAAVREVHEARLRRGVTISALAARTAADGYPLARSTLSRILNGKQATTWETVEVLAELLGVTLDGSLWAPDAVEGCREGPPSPLRRAG
jgi:ribosome-binding protein aMBF1 (putative translation factor)